MLSAVDFRVIRSFKQIVNGNIEVVRKIYQLRYAGLALAGFIAAYGILVRVQIDRKLKLRYTTRSADFSESQFKSPLDNIIP